MKNPLYIIRITLIVALGGFLMGFDASVISGVVKFIEPQFELTKLQLGWAVSCLTLSSTLAMLVSGPLSDRIGRRKILFYAASLYFISALFSALAPSFQVLWIARMIGGFGVGASLLIAPMYIAEIAPAKMRGRLVSFNQLNIVIGISVAFFTNYLILNLGKSPAEWALNMKFDEHNWRWMLGLETLPAIIYFLFLFIVPESPRWLVMKNRLDAAQNVLIRTNGEEAAKTEMDEIRESLLTETSKKKASLSELFKPAMKLVLIIGVVIAITQQITGINSVFFYAPMIFEQSGIGTNASFSQAIFVGITNLVFTLVAIWLIDKLGRKPLLMVGLSGIVISMAVLSVGFGTAKYELNKNDISELSSLIAKETIANQEPEKISLNLEQKLNTEISEKLSRLEGITFTSDVDFSKTLNSSLGDHNYIIDKSTITQKAIDINAILILIGILGFVASFAMSIGPVMWVLFSELFPNFIRGLAISLIGTINSAISFGVQLVFPWELANFGNSMTFMLYGIFGALGLLFVAMVLPETKGKSLEELEKVLIKTK